MTVLDTNVISEPLKSEPNTRVLDWLNDQDVETLYLTAVNVAELFYGVELLPQGKRKSTLRSALTKLIQRRIGERVLPFDKPAALEYATRMAEARRRGYNVSLADAQIASIAAVHDFPVATRDENAFQAMGVITVNPWKSR